MPNMPQTFRCAATFVLMLFALQLSTVRMASAQPRPATPQHEVRGLIVKLKPGATGLVQRESSQGARMRLASVAQGAEVASDDSRPVGKGHQLLRLRQGLQGEALAQALRRLRQHPEVASAEPDVRIKRLATTPNDTDFAAQQFHLQAPGPGQLSAINMPAAWDITTGSPVTVAVLDTGVRFSHPELQGRLLPGYDFVAEVDMANDGNGRDADASDPGDWLTSVEALRPLFQGCDAENSSWHGTFIAGQLAALTNNDAGVAGLNWNGRVLPVRISGKCGAMLSDILDGIRWAAGLPVDGVPTNPTPARIINLSFGGDQPCSASYQDVIDEITAAGALLVVAAGNEAGTARRPADCAGVLAVGAVNAAGTKTSYSNVGSSIGLSAPGGTSNQPLYSLVNDGLTSAINDTFGLRLGTSFSTPLAAGVASLMLSANPALSPAELLTRIRAGTRPFPVNATLPNCSASFAGACNCTTSTCGSGLLDGLLALQQAINPMVVVAAVDSPAPGTVVALDGRASSAAPGSSLVSYAWTQLSGPAVTVRDAAQALASVTLPALADRFVFSLRVTDSAGRTAEQTLSVNSVGASSAPVASAGSTGGSGGGGAWSGGWGLGLWALALGLVARRWLAVRRAANA